MAIEIPKVGLSRAERFLFRVAASIPGSGADLVGLESAVRRVGDFLVRKADEGEIDALLETLETALEPTRPARGAGAPRRPVAGTGSDEIDPFYWG